MGNLRALVTIAAIAFTAACGDDGGSGAIDAPKIIDQAIVIDGPPDAYVPDAPNYDFSCYQNTAPTTATATVQITGLAQEVMVTGTNFSIVPSAMVSTQACKGNCTGGNDLGTTGPTTSSGVYTSVAATTGLVPLEAYLIATKPNYRTNRIYPASPLTKNEAGVPVLMLSEALLAQLDTFNVVNQDADKSLFAILATDCSTPPIPIGGATVTVTRNGTPVGDAPQSAGLLDPMGEGLFLVTNVPAGTATISASYNGMTFRAHDVGAVANQITTSQVKPGF